MGMGSWILRDAELQKRTLVTLVILAAYRLLARIPLPGVDAEAVRSYFESHGSNAGGMMSIFALGLAPFLSASVLVQIFGPLFPACAQRRPPGNGARETAVRWAYRGALVISLLQAYFIARYLTSTTSFGGVRVVLWQKWPFTFMTMLSLSGAVMILIFLARLISRYGLGNGIAVLILAGIVGAIPKGIRAAWEGASRYRSDPLPLMGQAVILALIFVVLLCVVILFTVSVRRTPICYEGSSVSGSIPVRFAWPGHAPASLAYLPLNLCAFIPWLGAWDFLVPRLGWRYSVAWAFATYFFTCFYFALVFSPRRIAALMGRFKCRISDGSPGEKQDVSLDRAVSRYMHLTALFLIAVLSAPGFIAGTFGISHSVARIAGGASLLIVVGVLYDIQCQIHAYLEMKESGHGGDWSVADISWDEIEAEIKKGFLGTRGIPCVVEPSRFTWGMPIRTAVDEYRLWVPADRAGEARGALA